MLNPSDGTAVAWSDQSAAHSATVDDLIAQGAYPVALQRLLPSLQAGADDPRLLDRAAQCYWALNDADTALALMRLAVDGAPDLVAGWTKLAAMAASIGDREQALAALKTALKIGPKTASMLALLNRLEPIARGSADARRLKALGQNAHAPGPERAAAFNTLGRIEAAAGKHRAAFRWFAAGNAAHGEPYRPYEVTAMVAAQILKFDPARLPESAPGLPRMTFIVGMPRSGTTLAESILAQHPDIRALGEDPALSRTVMAMRRQVARFRGPRSAWDWYSELTSERLAAFRQYFLSQLPFGSSEETRMLVSKMPLDCFDIGAACALLPDARFVLMDRHPLDVGVSNFITNFHEGNAFSRRLDWIAHMMRSVCLSADDYQSKLGSIMRRQSYAALVHEPERETRALLAHIGLDWNAACLAPEAGRRIIRTASLSQVREGINKKGLGTWKPYAVNVQPLIEALGGMEAVEAWEAEDAARVIGSSNQHGSHA